jgi:hypothetical protein
MQKTPLMRLKEIEIGQPLEDAIRSGVEAGMNWVQIASHLGVPYATMNDWRRQLNIRTVRTVEFGTDAVAS